MKLLEILQKELNEFPEGMLYAVQDDDGEVKFGVHSSPYHHGGIWNRIKDGSCGTIQGLDLAEDWETAIVTKNDFDNSHPHPHAEMIMKCAEFAQTMSNPMSMFQHTDKGEWADFDEDANVAFYKHRVYRLKPCVKIIHGIEIPDLPFTPSPGQEFYCVNVGLPDLIEEGYMESEGCTFTQRMIERGLIYPHTEEGKQTAILHSKIMLGIA